MKHARPGLAAALLGALVACGPSDDRCAWLDPQLRYCLQPTGTAAPLDQRQKLVLSMGDQQHTLLADLQVDPNGQQMVLLTPLGQTVAQLAYDNRSARQAGPSGPWPAQLTPATLLGLVQLAWWPTAAVRAGLDSGWTVEESAGSRRILPSAGGGSRIDIGYTPPQGPYRHIRMVLPQRNVHLDIEVLETGDAAP